MTSAAGRLTPRRSGGEQWLQGTLMRRTVHLVAAHQYWLARQAYDRLLHEIADSS